jgi:hypothetical protein
MTINETDWALRALHDALIELAAPAKDQIAHLDSLGVLPSIDELALEFDDAVAYIPELVARGQLAPADADTISRIDQLLAQMSDQEELWTTAALQTHPSWEEVRKLARLSEQQIPSFT